MPDSPILDDRQMNFQLGDIIDVTNPLYSSLPAEEVKKLDNLNKRTQRISKMVLVALSVADLVFCLYVANHMLPHYSFTRKHLIISTLIFASFMVLFVQPVVYALFVGLFEIAVESSSHKEVVINHIALMHSEEGKKFLGNVINESTAPRDRAGHGRTFESRADSDKVTRLFFTLYRDKVNNFGARLVTDGMPGSLSCGFGDEVPEHLTKLVSTVGGLRYETATEIDIDMGVMSLDWLTRGKHKTASLLFTPINRMDLGGVPYSVGKCSTVLSTLIISEDKTKVLVILPVLEHGVRATCLSLKDFTLGGTMVIHKGEVPPESEWDV